MRKLALLAGILAVAALLRFARLGADLPLAVESTNAPALDAYWYLEKASAAADGVSFEASAPYDLEPWCSVARLWFLVVGSGHEAACALGALVGTLTVLAAFVLARPLGDRVAFAAAGLLAVMYPFVQHGRTPLIYGFVSLAMTAVTALAARGGRIAAGAALLLAVALPVALKPPAAALLGGLALAAVMACPPERRLAVVLALGAAAGGALAAVAAFDPLGAWTLNVERVRNYLGETTVAGLIQRLLTLGSRPRALSPMASLGSGLAVLSPAVLTLAALGGLSALRDLDRLASGPRRALAIVTGWAFAFVVAAVPLDYRPVRYHVPVFVPAAVLAAYALVRLVDGGPRASLPRSMFGRALDLAAAGVGGAVFAAHALDLALAPARVEVSIEWLGAAAAAGAFAAVGAVLLDASPKERERRLLVAALLAVLALDVLRDLDALRRPDWTTAGARGVTRSILPRSAVLAGPYSSVLAIGTGLERRRARTLDRLTAASPVELAAAMRRLGYTHFAADVEQSRRFGLEEWLELAGAAPRLVAVLYIRREPVFLYRLAWADALGCPETSFERARRIEDALGVAAAERALEEAGALSDPDLARAHVRALVHSGATSAAAAAARQAYAHMPGDAGLARLLLDADALADAVLSTTATAGSASLGATRAR